MPNKLTKAPVTPNDELLELLKDWVAPDVTADKKQELEGKTNFLGVPLNELYSSKKQTAIHEEEVVPQLTAEEIEKIRQDAYEEGFLQGKEAGYEAGFEEGKVAGIEEGKTIGHAEGVETGLAEGQAIIQQQSEEWQQLVAQLYDPIKRVDKAVEMQLLELAVSLAEAVIRTETTINPNVLLNILHEAVDSLPFNTEYCELHLHPDDIAIIKSVYDDDALVEQKWILKEEPAYNRGDLIVGTPNSLIDRTLKHRLKQTIDEFVLSAGLNKEQAPSPIALSEDLKAGINPSDTAVAEQATADNETDELLPDDSLDSELATGTEATESIQQEHQSETADANVDSDEPATEADDVNKDPGQSESEV